MKNVPPTAPFVLFDLPPYCPNPHCRWHALDLAGSEGCFWRFGARRVNRFPYRTRRYQCARCGKVFSDSVFYLFYRDRTEPTYAEIFRGHTSGKTRRDIAVDLGCSLDTVQRRFRELAAQGLLIQAHKTAQTEVKESVAYDGIENFAFSQYDPNNINHVVGRESLFLYDFNFSPLNRKGRMSPRQVLRKRQLENLHGPYPRAAIRTATRRILERLLARAPGDLLFHSDNHYLYREAIEKLPKKHRLVHFITLAKVHRGARNRLFAINHCDLLTRQKLTTFKRETVSFAKHSIAMVESFTLFMVAKNFLRPVFIKKQKRDPAANRESPAMRIRVATKILEFREFYGMRLQETQVTLNEDWREFFHRRDVTSRRTIAAA